MVSHKAIKPVEKKEDITMASSVEIVVVSSMHQMAEVVEQYTACDVAVYAYDDDQKAAVRGRVCRETILSREDLEALAEVFGCAIAVVLREDLRR